MSKVGSASAYPAFWASLKRLVEVDAAVLHLGEDVVGGAVEDAVQRAQAVSGGGFLDDAQDGNASGDAGFEADGQIARDGEGEEFVSVLGEQLLVGGDDGLAVLEGSAKKLEGVIDAAHGLDDDVNVVGGEELLPAGGDAGAGGSVFRFDRLAATDGGDDELDSAAALDERRVLGDDVGGGASDGAEADDSYADLFHKRVVSGRLSVVSESRG